jgi:hypothetical protein
MQADALMQNQIRTTNTRHYNVWSARKIFTNTEQSKWNCN